MAVGVPHVPQILPATCTQAGPVALKPSLGDSQAEGILAQSRVWPFAAPSGPS